MAIEIDLVKYGYKKKGVLGFSWTSFFFNFWVPLIRLDFKGLAIFITPWITAIIALYMMHDLNSELIENIAVSIVLIFYLIIKIILPFWYNGFYTKNLIKAGFLPLEDDEYSNAILKGCGYLEYTNKELLNKEKMERYEEIFRGFQKEKKTDRNQALVAISLLVGIISFFIFLANM